ncbi:MAG: [FeFe] hydrogenase H-cluster maturation GTPase HydF [Lachnospiraceae bacterium]|nr:[FeFe] hydrogenase H-cluster maturation GTPase HydF [Lachnospiraceae bacterium]
MGMNQTPAAERLHIAFFGKRNSGKSSIINAVTGQNLAIVSDVLGTTTDPVYKTMELLPVGPVMLIDTPGIDDDGELGALRVRKSYQVLNKTDVAILVVDGQKGLAAEDEKLIQRFQEKKIPYLVAFNKSDLLSKDGGVPVGAENVLLTGIKPDLHLMEKSTRPENRYIWVSAKEKTNIWELKEQIAALGVKEENPKRIVADLLEPSDLVILVIPIDKAAPKGRLILPQQQTIRDILDADAVSVVVKENELKNTLSVLGKKPKLVITDSQVFGKVSADTPSDIMLTSFSILFARYKGNLDTLVRGVSALDQIRDGDRILIAEGCTHHRQCDDIGTVKLPRWIENYTGAKPEYVFTSGTEFPEDLTPYRMIIHCGGCMLNEREMKYRIVCAQEQGIPITNYGTLIAHLNGILKRSLAPFPQIAQGLAL